MRSVKITYKNEWEYTELHIDLQVSYYEDYQIRMLSHNNIEGMLKLKGCGRNEESRYTFYLRSGMISMEKHYSLKEMGKEEVLNFTEQLMSVVERLKVYLLDPDCLILNPELIFLKEEKYYFCYLPASEKGAEKNLRRAFHEMTEYFVKNLDYHDTEGIFLVYRMHKETMEENYELKTILERYYEDRRERKNGTRKQEKRYSGYEKTEEPEQAGLSEGAVFYVNDEEENEYCKIYKKAPGKEMMTEKREPCGLLKKTIFRIKTGRWGEWSDLITEMDGQKTKGIL